VASACYDGRDAGNQRGHAQRSGDLHERIENGQIIAGGPETVLSQITRLHNELGNKVLPRMREF
jgi:hypothetical protein